VPSARTAGRARSLLAAILLLIVRIVPLAGQATTVAAGHVIRVNGSDTVAVPGARVVLHRVGRDVQGPIDSLVAGRDGSFRFRFRADTAALHILSSRYAGIEYFSPPLAVNPAQPDTGATLVVFDTSSTAPVQVEARHFVVSRPLDDGTRMVLELVVLSNAGQATRVGGDSLSPSWAERLPGDIAAFEIGEGDFSPEAVARRGDSLVVIAPIPPGSKQVVVQYAIAASVGGGGWRIPFDQPSATVNLLVEEPGTRVSGAALASTDSQTIEGRVYRRWSGTAKAGSVVDVRFPQPGATPRWLLPLLVGTTALALVLVAWRAALLRRPTPADSARPADLVEAIASLDARCLSREAEMPPEEWARYRAARARLMAELERALAANDRPS
jgi:hypothetical protein